MKIGIIGAGHIGGNLTRRLTSLGREVSMANARGPETLAELARETGATAVLVKEAAVGAGLVVVTVPQKSVPSLPAGVLEGVPVVFVTGTTTRSIAAGRSRRSRRVRRSRSGCRSSSASPC